MRAIKLKPLSEVANQIREEGKRDLEAQVKRIREQVNERIEQASNSRQAFALLEAAGIDADLYELTRGTGYTFYLGFFPNTKEGNRNLTEKLRQFRVALGCRLENVGKTLGNSKKKRIEYTLRAKDFPGIRVNFERRLPEGAKCRIVTQRSTYRSLVCEV